MNIDSDDGSVVWSPAQVLRMMRVPEPDDSEFSCLDYQVRDGVPGLNTDTTTDEFWAHRIQSWRVSICALEYNAAVCTSVPHVVHFHISKKISHTDVCYYDNIKQSLDKVDTL